MRADLELTVQKQNTCRIKLSHCDFQNRPLRSKRASTASRRRWRKEKPHRPWGWAAGQSSRARRSPPACLLGHCGGVSDLSLTNVRTAPAGCTEAVCYFLLHSQSGGVETGSDESIPEARIRSYRPSRRKEKPRGRGDKAAGQSCVAWRRKMIAMTGSDNATGLTRFHEKGPSGAAEAVLLSLTFNRLVVGEIRG
jgi:hypothetical protein